jgi:hypothetical protein
MLLKVPWHLLSYFWGSFIVLLWYSYHPAIIFLLYFYLTSTYSCVSIMGFTYGTHPLWTGRACHMGDHMAGQLQHLHTCTLAGNHFSYFLNQVWEWVQAFFSLCVAMATFTCTFSMPNVEKNAI